MPMHAGAFSKKLLFETLEPSSAFVSYFQKRISGGTPKQQATLQRAFFLVDSVWEGRKNLKSCPLDTTFVLRPDLDANALYMDACIHIPAQKEDIAMACHLNHEIIHARQFHEQLSKAFILKDGIFYPTNFSLKELHCLHKLVEIETYLSDLEFSRELYLSQNVNYAPAPIVQMFDKNYWDCQCRLPKELPPQSAHQKSLAATKTFFVYRLLKNEPDDMLHGVFQQWHKTYNQQSFDTINRLFLGMSGPLCLTHQGNPGLFLCEVTRIIKTCGLNFKPLELTRLLMQNTPHTYATPEQINEVKGQQATLMQERLPYMEPTPIKVAEFKAMQLMLLRAAKNKVLE